MWVTESRARHCKVTEPRARIQGWWRFTRDKWQAAKLQFARAHLIRPCGCRMHHPCHTKLHPFFLGCWGIGYRVPVDEGFLLTERSVSGWRLSPPKRLKHLSQWKPRRVHTYRAGGQVTDNLLFTLALCWGWAGGQAPAPDLHNRHPQDPEWSSGGVRSPGFKLRCQKEHWINTIAFFQHRYAFVCILNTQKFSLIQYGNMLSTLFFLKCDSLLNLMLFPAFVSIMVTEVYFL